MKYLKKVETLPSTLEEGVLYYNSTDDKVALKKAEPTPPTPTYEYVDLGLPNGTLWATCNIGANKPEEYGLYFQWGATQGYEGDEAKAHSIWSTAPFNNGSSDYDKAYFSSVSGTVCPNGVLATQYDAAYANTNGQQKMPTRDQINELTANTTTAWTSENGVNGVRFTSKVEGYTDKSVFVPASGNFYNGSQNVVGSNGRVWSSSLDSSNPSGAYFLDFIRGFLDVSGSNNRISGFAVRGVLAQN